MKSKLEPHIEDIKRRYLNGETGKSISLDYNVYPSVIINILRKHNVTIRKKGQMEGATPWNKNIFTSTEYKVMFSKSLFESDKISSLQEQTIRSHAKRILLHENGNICSICKNTEWCDKPIPLICDHIDGDLTNSNFSNFRLVCCNCDAQLPTFKSKNRGRGRTYDRLRYHKMK